MILLLLTNIVLSVGISSVNKLILSSTHGSVSPLNLVTAHFTVTAAYAALRVAADREPGPPLPSARTLRNFALMALANSASVVLMNSSLAANTVSFYTLCKLMAIPCSMGMQRALFGVRFSTAICASLAALTAGVALATASDSALTGRGCVLALLAVPLTSASQILSHRIQAQCGLPPRHFMRLAAGANAALVCVAAVLAAVSVGADLAPAPARDEPPPGGALGLLAFSCVLAVGINFSTAQVLASAGPVAYLVLGHVKTCIMVASSYLAFGQEIETLNLLGVAVSVASFVAYGVIKHTEKQRFEAGKRGGGEAAKNR